MKKILGAALALAMSLTCAGALAACDRTVEVPTVSDEEALSSAMAGLKAMYIDKYNNVETAKDYELVGQYPVKDDYCPIVWTVELPEGVTEGVTVSEMNETTKKVTIDVNETTPVEITYKLTASITYKDKTVKHTFENLTVPAYIPAPVEVGTIKFRLYQAKLDGGKTLYFKGEINGSEYGVTTENVAEAADVTIKEVNGGYTFRVGAKYLEIYTNSDKKVRLRLADTPTGAWEYNGTLKVFTWTEGETTYYLGTYGTFSTISASAISYISGDKAADVGVSQFPVEAVKAVAPGAYKIYLTQANLNKTLYFNGTINSSEYGATTEDVNEAADVVVAAVAGGNTLKVGDKYLELYTNSANKVRLRLSATSTKAWVYDYTLGVFTWTEGEATYYLGTYGTYDTISASTVSYISGDNADKVGVSQFPTQYKEVLGEGKYNLYLYQASLKKTLYFNGTINSSEYGATTENLSEAAEVVVAKVDGGYTLKVGDKYLEIYTNSANKVRLRLADTSSKAWVYDCARNAFTWVEGETTYYLGTYSTYDTISASAISYISGDNAEKVGVSQFVLAFEKVAD